MPAVITTKRPLVAKKTVPTTTRTRTTTTKTTTTDPAIITTTSTTLPTTIDRSDPDAIRNLANQAIGNTAVDACTQYGGTKDSEDACEAVMSSATDQKEFEKSKELVFLPCEFNKDLFTCSTPNPDA